MPETPAATLLFQAPTFQEPTFSAPANASQSETEEKPRRRSRTREVKAEETTEETTTKKRARSRKKTADDDASSEAAQPKRRRSRRKDQDEEASEVAEKAEKEQVAPASEAADSSDNSENGEETTRRRRRRRVRASEAQEGTDEVQALKGSTRLEAKKQRRKEGRREGRRHHRITESEFLARRESVNRKMVIRGQDGLDQIAIIEDDLLVEHYVARRTQKTAVGNIYMGRVQNVLPSMEAAFVDIGKGRNAVLYAGEVNWDAVGLEGKPRRIESALKSGDPVLVQVTKDPIGHKGARLTSQITLAGRYLVLIPGGSMMGISRKLPERERIRLKKILKQVVPDSAGVIVRTAAEGATEEQIRDDVRRLSKQWDDIESKLATTKNAPVLLRGEPELAVRVVRDIFNEDFAELIIEGSETYETVKAYVDELSPELSDRVTKWVGTEDVFHAYRVDEQLAKGMDRKVWLPSGGTLIIDRTEAMTVIDVNTGKFIGAGGTLEETVTRNNLEAAEEIVRQLRLRDIGGIVIIDFVDMVLESNRDLVLRRLVECLGRDRTRHQVTEITSLGLVQMTRKRVGEGLVEAFSTTCEACEGRGFIVHHHPVEIQGAAEEAPKRSKKSQNRARVEDSPEHERAREAMTAIAAASNREDSAQSAHQDGEAQVSDEKSESAQQDVSQQRKTVREASAEAKRQRRSRGITRPQEDGPAVSRGEAAPEPQDAPTVAPAQTQLQSAAARDEASSPEKAAKPSRPARSRRRRAVSEASEPTRVHIDLPEPAAPVAATHTTQEIVINVPARSEETTPVKRSRRRRVAVSEPAAPPVEG
ncbi:Rne/Rng family ribonuclease [uncultured Actinomyces sp.]|uniref:Rne/Rng family ribonuclease n=1 Tax=uncultured Actinomyces sp. TaxID=249061 RepID=UPI0028EBE2FB|nr:Rne/Rng family ribonuclease [uncultured Actinomyces sp.]